MNEDTNLEDFQKIIKINFSDLELLKRSLIHRSYLNESKENDLRNNERLEFLGDAVLELFVTEYLFYKYPNRPEGELTSFRSATVKTESLAETAQKLNYGRHIYMSKGEESTGGRERPYILANTFESVLGAIYLDKGIETSKLFLETNLFPKIEDIVVNRLDIDNKSKLQELSQDVTGFTPTYNLVNENGPDHEKVFTMGVVIDTYQFGLGNGKSKQEAEQNAAAEALKNWDELHKKFFESA